MNAPLRQFPKGTFTKSIPICAPIVGPAPMSALLRQFIRNSIFMPLQQKPSGVPGGFFFEAKILLLRNSNHSTIQPFNHSTIQPFNHSTIQQFNNLTI